MFFKWRHFEPEIIVCTVCWYLRYSLSYRDVQEMLGERGISVDHSTIMVQALCTGTGAAPAGSPENNEQELRVDET